MLTTRGASAVRCGACHARRG
ncbi:hypothetical protein [Gordonibacter sp. 28C]